MRKIYIACAVGLLTACTGNLYKKGIKHYEKTAYSSAIENFEKYLTKADKADAKIKLANSYRMVNDLPNAERWYAKIVQLPESEPVNMFYYGKILMSLEKYEDAKVWLGKYLQAVPDDFVAEMLLASCYTVKSFKKDTSLYSVKEIEMPEVETAFGQIPYQSGIMFTADKLTFKKNEKYNWTGRSYLNIYFSKKDERGRWLSPMELKGDINGQFHEGPACFTKDGNTVYFTRSNYSGKSIRKNANNDSYLKIYRAELVGEKWTNLLELPFNSDDFSCGHPTLSSDEKTIYFISDRPGGFGGTDIYQSTFNGTDWSKPLNLGATVNTSGNEMFPYMHSDGTLYFSSEAHNNLGGLDVFMTTFDGTKWLQVENLNYPLNSPSDDFAYVVKNDNKTGYLSSNRSGNDKMYEVTKHDPTFILSGFVKDRSKKTGIDSAYLEINNLTTGQKYLVYTQTGGIYKTKLNPGSKYLIKAGKAMYFPVSESKTVSTEGKKVSENFTASFELEQMIIEKPIVLQNIYYDLDKWTIRTDAATELDKLVEVLKENPKIHIELSSHTDSRAGDQYNLVLSDKRAKAAVEYLISKGIEARRLKAKGYGENAILNKCKNNVVCSEEEHQLNRRTEFKVIKATTSVSVK